MTSRRPGAEDPLGEDPARGFMTDAPPEVVPADEEPALEQVLESPDTGPAVVTPVSDVLEIRPRPAAPREYHFPPFQRDVLASGMTVVSAHVPGRPLLLAQLIIGGEVGGGAAGEPPGIGGVTVLTARALLEGTARRDATELVEASERLGSELSADAGWDSFVASVEVPRSRLVPALELLAEAVLEPSFPEQEVDRLRDERLNDLRQARADPRRRVERVFPEAIYANGSAYRRPLAGIEESVRLIDRTAVVERHRSIVHPQGATLVVAGDLTGIDAVDRVAEAFAAFAGYGNATPQPRADAIASDGRPRVVLVDRPGSPQSEIRIGHVGLPRLIPDFHAVSVLNTLLGGLFNSRMNLLLREQRGYTYGVHTSFDLRRAAGPFVVRCAVQTEVTVPAVQDILSELRRIREAPVSSAELQGARDYLVGVFPLRFETAGQVAAAIGGLGVFGLPDDELDRYRPAISAVTADDVLQAARDHIRPGEAAIVIVGDAARFEADLRGAGLGKMTVVREGPAEGAE
jgi:zinc protease